MPQQLFILVYSSPLFPAHWSLWIPTASNPNHGRRIHVTGDAKNGFQLELDRTHDLSEETRKFQRIPLTQIDNNYVVDTYGCCPPDTTDTTDTENMTGTAMDDLERVAMKTPAPGPSLGSAQRVTPRQRVEIKNCQTWMYDFVRALIEDDIMGQEVIDLVDQVPKN